RDLNPRFTFHVSRFRVDVTLSFSNVPNTTVAFMVSYASVWLRATENLMILEPSPHSPVELDLLDVQMWNVYWAEIERRIGPVFARSDARERAMSYLAGLLSPAERKNSWQLAEQSGDPNPYGFQHLLGRADWD